MSPFERLLALYTEYRACPEGSPDQAVKAKIFEDAVYQAAQDGSFNDQLPPIGIRAWVHSAWRDRQR